MLGISIRKSHELVPVVENKDPHRLHGIWNKLPVNHTFKFPLDKQHYFGAEPIFNDDLGRLTGTEPLFLGARVAVIDPFFITCNNSPDMFIIHAIIDKLTTDIHSRLSLFRCQFMRYRFTDSVWFSKCLNLAMYGIFWCATFFWQPTSTFCRFSCKTLYMFSVSHNLDFPVRGKCLVFYSPVLKRWNIVVPHAYWRHLLLPFHIFFEPRHQHYNLFPIVL